MSDIQRLETNKRMSRVVIHNGIVYLSGFTPKDAIPTRATCEARLAAPEIRIEIIVTAAL